jgi:aspartyl-tRNA(Asn)/glutamyl-tRNA(Gln) amidotransferase subunit C
VTISLDDVRHIAALARLGVSREQARAAAVELSSILEHMQVLSQVDTGDGDLDGIEQDAMLLRADAGPPIPLMRPPTDFAPSLRDGFFLVPRLATHEDPEPLRD